MKLAIINLPFKGDAYNWPLFHKVFRSNYLHDEQRQGLCSVLNISFQFEHHRLFIDNFPDNIHRSSFSSFVSDVSSNPLYTFFVV
jgi:hypothetical protein